MLEPTGGVPGSICAPDAGSDWGVGSGAEVAAAGEGWVLSELRLFVVLVWNFLLDVKAVSHGLNTCLDCTTHHDDCRRCDASRQPGFNSHDRSRFPFSVPDVRDFIWRDNRAIQEEVSLRPRVPLSGPSC